MTYWFDHLSEEELVANALLLGAEFMTPEMTKQAFGYGPYYRYREDHGGWSIGYTHRGVCARQYLQNLERLKTPMKP